MAKEYIYGRGRDGYKTLLKSYGLSENFIDTYLQGYCSYTVSSNNINPPVYFLGGSNKQKDFFVFGENTLQYDTRNYSYSHIYIVDNEKELKSAFLNISEIIGFDNYKRNISETASLSEELNIENIIKAPLNRCFGAKFVFDYLKLDINKFKFIVYKVADASLYNKVIYIKLNCKDSMISFLAKEIMRSIYMTLPFTLRKNLRYISYASDINLYNFFNVIFVPGNMYLNSVNAEVVDLNNELPLTQYPACIDFMASTVFYNFTAALKSNFYISDLCFSTFNDLNNSFLDNTDDIYLLLAGIKKQRYSIINDNFKFYCTILGQYIEYSRYFKLDCRLMDFFFELKASMKTEKGEPARVDYILNKRFDDINIYSAYFELFFLDFNICLDYIKYNLIQCSCFKDLLLKYYFYLCNGYKLFNEVQMNTITSHFKDLSLNTWGKSLSHEILDNRDSILLEIVKVYLA